MKIQNAKQDIPKLLSCFSEVFSRPSFKIFSSFITGFIQLGKEAHTSSMVQSLTYPFLHRSLSSFTRFLGQNVWALEEVAEIALEQFFHTLRIKAHSVLFLIIDDTIAQKSGKKIPGCSWYKDHAQNMANVFGHQWVLSAWLYKDFLLPLWAKLYGLGKGAVVVVKEKRKKTSYLVSTNLHLSALDIIRYYAKRWKIEQMIKDLKQRLGFGDYQVRNLQAIQRHVALSLLSYTLLILLKILQWLRDQTVSLDVSIRLLAFQVRRHILLKHITLTLNRMKVEFNQSFLDIYLEKLWA